MCGYTESYGCARPKRAVSQSKVSTYIVTRGKHEAYTYWELQKGYSLRYTVDFLRKYYEVLYLLKVTHAWAR
jgi:hypothetical protein